MVQKDVGFDAFWLSATSSLWTRSEPIHALGISARSTGQRKSRFMIYGGPCDGTSYRQLPQTQKLAELCEHLVAWKIPVRGVATGPNPLAECVSALKEAGEVRKTVTPLVGRGCNSMARWSGAVDNVNACERRSGR